LADVFHNGQAGLSLTAGEVFTSAGVFETTGAGTVFSISGVAIAGGGGTTIRELFAGVCHNGQDGFVVAAGMVLVSKAAGFAVVSTRAEIIGVSVLAGSAILIFFTSAAGAGASVGVGTVFLVISGADEGTWIPTGASGSVTGAD
jgi:hypothetical protein